MPVPEVGSITELNELIDAWDKGDEERRIGAKPRTIGEHFAIEQPLLAPLPDDEFETGRWFTPRVDRYGQVTVRMNKYSVPAGLIGRQVRVLLHASHLVVYAEHREVARHERLMGRGETRLELDHYLETLLRKPGALPGSTALAQARAAGTFTAVHDQWWARACKAHGDAAGTRALIEVLLLHRHMKDAEVVRGLERALRVGALTADAVALEARLGAESSSSEPSDDREQSRRSVDRVRQDVVDPALSSLTERRLRQLPSDTRPLPSVAAYDDLLPSRRQANRPNP